MKNYTTRFQVEGECPHCHQPYGYEVLVDEAKEEIVNEISYCYCKQQKKKKAHSAHKQSAA